MYVVYQIIIGDDNGRDFCIVILLNLITMNALRLVSRLTCPYLPQAIEEFSETISLLFDVDEPTNNPLKKRIIAKWKK